MASPKSYISTTGKYHTLSVNNHEEQTTFIPPEQNSDFLNIWKDFRNDVRKKL